MRFVARRDLIGKGRTEAAFTSDPRPAVQPVSFRGNAHTNAAFTSRTEITNAPATHARGRGASAALAGLRLQNAGPRLRGAAAALVLGTVLATSACGGGTPVETPVGSSPASQTQTTQSGAQSFRAGDTTVQVTLLASGVSGLSAESASALALLQALGGEGVDSESQSAALKRLMNFSGLTEGPSGFVLDSASLNKMAKAFANVGLPMGAEGIERFFLERNLPAAHQFTPSSALLWVESLTGHQVIYQLPGGLSSEQQAALALYQNLTPQQVSKLQRKLDVRQLVEGPVQLQVRKLNNSVVGESALNWLVTSLTVRGVSLTPGGIASFRKANDLGPGTKVDHSTALKLMEAIIAPSSTQLGPKPTGQSAKADWYRQIVESQELVWRDGTNEVNVVALRAFDVVDGLNHNAFNQWNDTVALIWKDKSGARHVKEFRATTDPGLIWVSAETGTTDLNGDGSGDVATIAPGQYPYDIGTHPGSNHGPRLYGALQPDHNVTVYRNFNHDDRISGIELRRPTPGFGVNFHWGPGWGSHVDGWSAGCVVLYMERDDMLREFTSIAELDPGQLLPIVIDARELQWAKSYSQNDRS